MTVELTTSCVVFVPRKAIRRGRESEDVAFRPERHHLPASPIFGRLCCEGDSVLCVG